MADARTRYWKTDPRHFSGSKEGSARTSGPQTGSRWASKTERTERPQLVWRSRRLV
ncbi:uncharacterized protein SCHCODRAFT_02312698 [Schizophyllum commune H4-8]|uniref:uncharacterized protein n=1 Tax=Schizophyllum commune (strain H4-8 / FGSC 9210) TaxID=578458 RepID=UPI00215F5EA5|nr:uncharacterized protein SCHCODRAFT_02312698 [Schizophyllum commune H4-8]KAI5891193.1 hypothetical protein SCHCODRAFT_02312698 [Schizophyllum commune H4-8]